MARLAQLEGARLQLSHHELVIWGSLAAVTAAVMAQLLTDDSNPRLDLGLRKHYWRVDRHKLVNIYWWILLYHLLLFKNFGAAGYVEDDFPKTYNIAQRFIHDITSETGFALPSPLEWDVAWLDKTPARAAIDMTRTIRQDLGLPISPKEILIPAAQFFAETSMTYDYFIRPMSGDEGKV